MHSPSLFATYSCTRSTIHSSLSCSSHIIILTRTLIAGYATANGAVLWLPFVSAIHPNIRVISCIGAGESTLTGVGNKREMAVIEGDFQGFGSPTAYLPGWRWKCFSKFNLMRKINSFHFNRIKNFLFLFASTDRHCRARTMVMGDSLPTSDTHQKQQQHSETKGVAGELLVRLGSAQSFSIRLPPPPPPTHSPR